MRDRLAHQPRCVLLQTFQDASSSQPFGVRLRADSNAYQEYSQEPCQPAREVTSASLQCSELQGSRGPLWSRHSFGTAASKCARPHEILALLQRRRCQCQVSMLWRLQSTILTLSRQRFLGHMEYSQSPTTGTRSNVKLQRNLGVKTLALTACNVAAGTQLSWARKPKLGSPLHRSQKMPAFRCLFGQVFPMSTGSLLANGCVTVYNFTNLLDALHLQESGLLENLMPCKLKLCVLLGLYQAQSPVHKSVAGKCFDKTSCMSTASGALFWEGARMGLYSWS